MSTLSLACQLMCASEAAYAIDPTAPSGQYNPLYLPGTTTIDPNKVVYQKQYDALGLIGDPYIVTDLQIEACLVGKTNTGIIVAFRGTLPPALTWDSFFDWLQDFFAVPTSNINLPGEVHSGYLFAVISLIDGVKNAINALDPSGSLNLFMTGHSKGGGMAPIAAQYMKGAFGIQTTQTITFAGPNPGNADFCKVYNQENPNDIRYANYLDIVPLLPPAPNTISDIEAIPNLPGFILDLLNDAKTWNYDTVGGLWYIDSSKTASYISPDYEPILLAVRLGEIGSTIGSGDISAIANAHHADCGFGYMQGACNGDVCTT